MENTMPDPSTRKPARRTVRKSVTMPDWIEQAIITAAHRSGATQAEIVNDCLEIGLLYGYGIRTSPSARGT
jgi:hypothetical protein